MPADITNIPGVVTAFGCLLSIGAVTWFIRSGTAVVLAQRDAGEARKDAAEAKLKANALESRVNQQDTIINEIRTRMSPLEKIPELVAAMEFIKDAVTKQMVPRAEHEAKWQSIEQRISRLESHSNQAS